MVSEIISNLEFNLVVVKPDLECNTGLMYKKLDELKNREIPNNSGYITKALFYNDLDLLVNNLFNSFEDVVDCNDIKKNLIDSGAMGALLSGSGSCVFGIYKNKEAALKANEVLKSKYLTFVCNSVNMK